MICPYCNKEYFDKNQKICEFCGSDLIIESSNVSETIINPKTKLDSFLNDLGLNDIYKKIKKKYNNMKERFKDL